MWDVRRIHGQQQNGRLRKYETTGGTAEDVAQMLKMLQTVAGFCKMYVGTVRVSVRDLVQTRTE